MAYIQPFYSHSQETVSLVDLAGDALIGIPDAQERFADMAEVLSIVNNWRASHQYPLNTFLQTLRNRAFEIERVADVTSRIKRRQAIEAKLIDRPDIKLSFMQDIGGCRAVFSSVKSVYDLADKYKKSSFLHEEERVQDYISLPRRTGYRSYHAVYKHYSRRWPIFDEMRIEIQMRSQLQHLWATAVEMADVAFLGQLKAGKGDANWLRFFLLMSSAMAELENCPRVPDAPRNHDELIEELRDLAQQLDVATRMKHFGRSIRVMGQLKVSSSDYVVLVLDPPKNIITITVYPAHDAAGASAFYDEREKNKPVGGDVLLVRAADAAAVRRGYPSFFRDADAFLQLLGKLTS
jgi:hypothetical protein